MTMEVECFFHFHIRRPEGHERGPKDGDEHGDGDENHGFHPGPPSFLHRGELGEQALSQEGHTQRTGVAEENIEGPQELTRPLEHVPPPRGEDKCLCDHCVCREENVRAEETGAEGNRWVPFGHPGVVMSAVLHNPIQHRDARKERNGGHSEGEDGEVGLGLVEQAHVSVRIKTLWDSPKRPMQVVPSCGDLVASHCDGVARVAPFSLTPRLVALYIIR